MANLELHNRLSDGSLIFVQPLVFIAPADRAAWLKESYGKRADQFVIVERKPLSAAQKRAIARWDAREEAAIGPPSAPVPSAASAILAKLAQPKN
jgi:hypothetical protein